MGFSDANYHFNDTVPLSINSKTVSEANRPADQDILESIEAAYFSIDENYDICRFELGKLPEALDCDEIQRDFKNLKQQHQVVSKKVLQLILEHQNSCNEEFKHVLEVLDKVKKALDLCRISRKELSITKREYQELLFVLANYRKRKLAQNLLNNLKMIKDLYNFDNRLNCSLSEGDYVGAILELQRCQRIANKYRHFTCVAALTYKLQETMENVDNQLDKALAQTCLHFSGDFFFKLQEAFRLIEKPQSSVIDNLHVHFITAIYNQSMNVVQTYVSSHEVLISSDTNGRNPYKTLCHAVPQEVFIPCLIDLCKVLFKIVLSYHKLLNWYNNQDNEYIVENSSPDREYGIEKRKLEHNLVKIWDDIQRKVSSLLLNVDLSIYKFDQFVQVLSVIHRLIQVGDEFCMSKSEELLESIRRQSINYFKNYHAARLDELRIFFENEIWELCPVKSTFNILQLQEFKSLRSLLRNFKRRSLISPQVIPNSSSSNDCCSSTHSQDGSSIYGNYFIRHANYGTPFDSGLDETIIDEDILADENDASGYFSEDSDDDSIEMNNDSGDEISKTPPKEKKDKLNNQKAPILTNTTLSVLRQMGKYLQMSRLLRPIAYKIVMCMTELFYYNLFVVHYFFAGDLTISSNTLYSNQLNVTLKKISDNMILHNQEERETSTDDDRILKPNLSPIVELKNPEQLSGLSERIVAVESLIYLASQFQALQEFLEYLIPQSNKFMLDQFFQQDVVCAVDLRKPVYMSVCVQAFDLRQILIMMSKINWEVKDVMSQHSYYVDVLLKEVHIFNSRLEKVSNKIPIPNVVLRVIWEDVAHIITHTLVQGFSEAKKCSNGGRALMQLDFTQFLSKFEKISNLKPVPHKAYVENYVKAYYLPEYELENWMKEHNEYSTKHFYGLVCCVCQNNKKTRQRLLQIIEDMEKNQVSDR
ncbi:hypothetical protein WA026_015875 [Henosepilachna vigintioctopunctata]